MPFLGAAQGATSFNQPVGFDTSKVTKMNRMFEASAHAPSPPPTPPLAGC